MLIARHIAHCSHSVRMSYSCRNLSKAFGIIVLFAYFLKISAIDIDCSRPPQLVEPHTCCPDGGRDEVVERCATRFGITRNRTQQPSAETATCLAQCVLSEAKYLMGQNLNIAAVRMDLQQKFPQDPEYVEAMSKAYQKCVPIAQRKLEDLRKSAQGSAAIQRSCSPFSGIVLGCTYMEYFQNCPANRWNPNAQCQVAKQFLQKCAIF